MRIQNENHSQFARFYLGSFALFLSLCKHFEIENIQTEVRKYVYFEGDVIRVLSLEIKRQKDIYIYRRKLVS